MKMYLLIKAHHASKAELETVYTLDEALKLFALMEMDTSIQQGQMREMEEKAKH